MLNNTIQTKQICRAIKKTLTVILVGVFLFNSWAQEERSFSTGIENSAFSSGPAQISKLSARLRTTTRNFKERYKAAAICRFIESNINSSLEDVSNQLHSIESSFDEIQVSLSPNEIIIEIPDEGMAVRYFDPTKANVITPYADVRKLRTKVISPRLNRQIIHRTLAISQKTDQSHAAEYRFFAEPQRYRKMILEHVRLEPLLSHSGESNFTVFNTKGCPVGCTHCYFGSQPFDDMGPSQTDSLTSDGIEKAIAFTRAGSVKVVDITGGGDPFYGELENVLKEIMEVQADTILISTSGFWADDMKSAEEIIEKLHRAFKERAVPARLVLKLSVDRYHVQKLTLQPALNLIDIFQNKFKDEEGFTLLVKSLEEDDMSNHLLDELPVAQVEHGNAYEGIRNSYESSTIVTLDSGFRFRIVFKELVPTDSNIDLNDQYVIAERERVYDREIQGRYADNTARATHPSSEEYGMNLMVYWNGDILLWGIGIPDNQPNIYRQNYDKAIESFFDDVLYLSFWEKGVTYRDNLVREVNPKAVIRQKVYNIRTEEAASTIYTESKTRLYLAIRVIQDYIEEGRISHAEVQAWPQEIQYLVGLDKQALIRLYSKSEHSIVDDFLERPGVTIEELSDLYKSVALGHYNISVEDMRKIIIGTNRLTSKEKSLILQDTTVEEKSTDDSSLNNHMKDYTSKNKDLFQGMFGKDKPGTLARVPVEILDFMDVNNISKFLGTFQEPDNAYVELYYMSGTGEVAESVYQKFGLKKKPLPKGFKRTRENTVTLFPAFKGETLDEASVLLRLGSLDMGPEDTILSPVGIQHDSTGLIRGTILGLIMMQIARDISQSPELLENPELRDRVQREVLEHSKGLWDPDAKFRFSPQDLDNIIGLIAGNKNSIVPALNKLIKLLPVTPIDPEELREAYEHAAKQFA